MLLLSKFLREAFVDAPAQSSIEIDGLKIGYDSVGKGSPTVVLVHGAFADRSYFGPQIEHLSPRRRVVALDLRGHGSSAAEKLCLQDLAADVIGVCDAERVQDVVLCGHSIVGGAVALAVTAARPDLVRAVALLDTVLFPPDAWRNGLDALRSVVATDRWLDALRGYLARTLAPQDPPGLVARVMADVARTQPGVARDLVALFDSDLAAGIPDVRCPLLYVHAKAPADLARLAQVRPDAWIGQVVGSGHYLTLAVPEQVNAMLDRFIDVVGQAS
jgi:pimeloyl-ACP methyl ester carboxylesterase